MLGNSGIIGIELNAVLVLGAFLHQHICIKVALCSATLCPPPGLFSQKAAVAGRCDMPYWASLKSLAHTISRATPGPIPRMGSSSSIQ